MSRCFVPTTERLERRNLQATLGLTVSPPTTAVAPFIAGPGDPTPAEQARERFTASFSGKFVVGPPRFTGQSAYLVFKGNGSSTQFRHGNYAMGVVLPSQPGGPITGAAFLQDKNLSGGTEIGLDINFDPTSLDSRGRPTLGAWSVDSNIYSGIDFVAQGTGTVAIRYVKNTALVTFMGQVYTNGLTNPLANQ
jgi:hypothetical protein